MSPFIIEPSKKQYARVYENTFLWNEDNIYVMANHRLALWCWLQCENISDKQHNLIHIDEHTDARRWEGLGEPECLEQALSVFDNLKDFNTYESLQCPFRDPWTGKETRPCITYDNFVHLAVKAKVFNHYYIYSSTGDWHTGLPEKDFHFFKKLADIYGLVDCIKQSNGKCVIDIDLDFFDFKEEGFSGDDPKDLQEEDLLKFVFNALAEHRDLVSMITISLNESPGDPLWEKRQNQMEIVKDILKMNIPIPVCAF
ncbi:MAG: hypothetical protein RI935_478 [Candidatus Parcubacteria bacterium]|jgi:hypothetical protein